MNTTAISNVLAERYATEAMRKIWSEEGKIRLEREFWIAVMRAQRDLGLPIPDEAIHAYVAVKDRIDLDDIRAREKVTRHDVKARIDAFCALAGHEHIHKGLTSRDLTENVEQWQVRRALQLIIRGSASALLVLARRVEETRDLVITARTHNVAAQPTTLGKRLAMFGEAWLRAAQELERFAADYPIRGIKGATGTQLDLWTLFEEDPERVQAFEDRMRKHLGCDRMLENTGQVYPRSQDFDVVARLFSLAAAPADLARTVRLMAGHGLLSEGFAEGQVGSSAMPHKMNSRSCERINGFHTLLRGYVTMASGMAGDQWNEGDVSCSVVRRVVLPDSFFVMDGLLETLWVVLDRMEVFPEAIARENRFYQPLLATTTILMEAVKAGAGREEAHAAIKEHAVAYVRGRADTAGGEPDLVSALAQDKRLKLDENAVRTLVERTGSLTGRAGEQTDRFLQTARTWAGSIPGAAEYRAGAIL